MQIKPSFGALHYYAPGEKEEGNKYYSDRTDKGLSSGYHETNNKGLIITTGQDHDLPRSILPDKLSYIRENVLNKPR